MRSRVQSFCVIAIGVYVIYYLRVFDNSECGTRQGFSGVVGRICEGLLPETARARQLPVWRV